MGAKHRSKFCNTEIYLKTHDQSYSYREFGRGQNIVLSSVIHRLI